MSSKRIVRLNSLLKEVISDVIHKGIHHNAFIDEFVTVTRVEITSDLDYAKVFVSILQKGKKAIDKNRIVEELNNLSRPIAHTAMKQVRMRQFPQLQFFLDVSLENQLRMEDIFSKISNEREKRAQSSEESL